MRFLNALLAISMLAIMTSCVSVTYVGKTFPATKKVAVYLNRADIPKDYKMIGAALATAPESVPGRDIEGDLIEKAKKVGADAILIVGVRKVKTGEYTDGEFDGDDLGDDFTEEEYFGPNVGAGMNSFGQIAYDRETVYEFDTEIKAELFRKQ